ncbi:MAG: DNA recombination protein RmuC [Thermaurantiacus sp.]
MGEAVLLLLVALGAAALALVLGFLLWGRPLASARSDVGVLRPALEAARDEGQNLREARAAQEARIGELVPKLEAAEAEARRAAQLDTRLAAFEAAAAERERAHEAQLLQLREEFQRLAGEALRLAQQSFTDQAAETLKVHRAEADKGLTASKQALADLIAPMRETLGRYESELKELEQKREQAYGNLAQQLSAVAQGQEAVRTEAGRIVAALRSSARASGAWGEAQLRNVMEMAGLREGIDFVLQAHTTEEDGSRRRPDAVIRLPGGRELVIDSKCSLQHFLAASEAQDDDARSDALKRHAAAVRVHARGLAEKAYWKQFASSADFVVMFLPGENFLSAALEQDMDLLGWALDQRILLAGPTNLLAIARVVAMVWRQEKMAEEAQQVAALGSDLYQSLVTMADHISRVGRNIGEAAVAYNDFIGSLEMRVLAKARRFTELGVEPGRKVLPELRAVDTGVRPISRPELLPPGQDAAE